MIFNAIKKDFEKNGTKYVDSVKGIFVFHVLKKDEKQVWVINGKNDNGSVKQNPAATGYVVITMKDDELLQVMLGKVNAQQAFFKGKLLIKGSIALATEMDRIMPKDCVKTLNNF